jgi:hypothetical protein
MNPDAKFDAALRRQAGVPLDEAGLQFGGAAQRVDHATEFNQRPVASPFKYAPIVHGDGRFDKVTAQRSQPSQRAILVRGSEPTKADNIGGQDGCEFPCSGHPVLKPIQTNTAAKNVGERQIRLSANFRLGLMASTATNDSLRLPALQRAAQTGRTEQARIMVRSQAFGCTRTTGVISTHSSEDTADRAAVGTSIRAGSS